MGGDGTKSIWWNGGLIPHADAKVHVLTHALHYGTGVFEGIRAYRGPSGLSVFRLSEHIDRLFDSAAAYKIDMPVARDRVVQGCVDVVRDNALDSCYLRPIAFVGFGPLGVYWRNNPTNVAIAAFPWGTYLGPEALEKGIRVTISSWTRIHHAQFPTTAKGCGQYLNSVLAVREAHEKGFDEALLLDRHGNVSEGSGENLFVIKNGRLRTPGLDSSILPGITRASIMELAVDLGVPVDEGAVTRGELYTADEAFFTGTAAEVTPIREIDGHIIGAGGRGPLTTKLQAAYLDAVNGKLPSKKHWLTPV
ncbi:MAG: branched-chain amino acid transaminase [Planctomycetota bacterium]|nr:branched-chain amino acid transaminase [Planctomycetota bacterium]